MRQAELKAQLAAALQEAAFWKSQNMTCHTPPPEGVAKPEPENLPSAPETAKPAEKQTGLKQRPAKQPGSHEAESAPCSHHD